VTAPIPIYKPEPPYTERARRRKIEGTSVLWAIIGADGAVQDVTIEKSLDQGLDQNAVDTIKTWEFKPAMKAGKPVACRVVVEVSFRLF
jgi:TonB family protein